MQEKPYKQQNEEQQRHGDKTLDQFPDAFLFRGHLRKSREKSSEEQIVLSDIDQVSRLRKNVGDFFLAASARHAAGGKI